MRFSLIDHEIGEMKFSIELLALPRKFPPKLSIALNKSMYLFFNFGDADFSDGKLL